MISRKNFLKTASLGLASTSLPFTSAGIASYGISKSTLAPMGIAGYTFRFIDNPRAIEMMKRLQVKETTLKDFQLPLDSSQKKIDDVVSKFNEAGITIYGVGVIYMKTKADVDQAFEYAKKVDVPIIVGVPNHELIPYAEKKVKAYDIKLAIHNHGPEDDLYPGPDVVYEKVKNLDPRMGLCFDIGHSKRDGIGAAEGIKKYHDRIFDMHIKDVTKAAENGKATEVGRGVIDFPDFIQTLINNNYTGHYSLEYENDMKDPLPGMAESIGYFKGVRDTITEN